MFLFLKLFIWVFVSISEIYSLPIDPPEEIPVSVTGRIQALYPDIDVFYSELRERVSGIYKQIEQYRPRIERAKQRDSFYSRIERESVLDGRGSYLVDPERLHLILEGLSGSYFLVDADQKNKFVVKPIDEDCSCMNNPKRRATLFLESQIRKDMPLYCSSLKEALTYEIAQNISVTSISPKTALAILESSRFSYLIDRVDFHRLDRCLECGPFPREKLCSVQEFVEDSKSLFQVLEDLQQRYAENSEEFANRFDQAQFEDLNLLIWTTYDTDAHSGNILVYVLGLDAEGNEIYGFKKIDNGLAFPEKNWQLRNALGYLPNSKRPFSDRGREKVRAIDVEILAEKMKSYGLDGAIPALYERMSLLKELVERPNITIDEIGKEMTKLEDLYAPPHSSSKSFYSDILSNRVS